MNTKFLALFLCLMMVFSLCACGTEAPETPDTTVETEASTELSTETTASDELTGIWADAIYTEDTEFGEGAKTVKVHVVAEDKTVVFTINTDAETLGAALLEHSLVEGEESQYGLYIKKVNGMTADYDIDQTYWGLTKNGEYLMSGADTTTIADGEQYELTRTK